MPATALPATLQAPADALSADGPDAWPRLQRHLMLLAPLLILAVGLVTWVFVDRSQQALIEFKARTLAEVVARQATSARSVYAAEVVGKLARDGAGQASEQFAHERGNVPLPAQFLKLAGRHASAESQGLFRWHPISRWNLGEGQAVEDDFQRWAWARLEAQDQARPRGPIAWQPVWRVEAVDGQRTLRLLWADAATSQACADCHNALERRPEVLARRVSQGLPPGRQWQQHQLLGALEVQVPLAPVEALAATQRRHVLAAVLALAGCGVLAMLAIVHLGSRRASRLTRRLAWAASHDSLTGLVNRPQLEQRLTELLQASRRDDSRHVLMFLDLDQFKVINDSCGHAAGDALLRAMGELLQRQLRATDTLARLGGDEFGILLGGCNAEAGARVAQKLLDATAGFRFTWAQHRFELGVSIGLVEVHRDSVDVATLMSAADIACYAAKEDGRHRLRQFRTDDAELQRRRTELAMAEQITEAFAHDRVALAVQTARALDDALPVQAYQELLLRVTGADGRPLPTGPLIAAAERMNMMANRIDRWVLQTACAHIASGRLVADRRHLVALNLSAHSLCDAGFLDFAVETIRASGIDPAVLCIEVTETAAMTHLDRALAFVRTLKALGCKFALDDFGAGMSSFAYLKHLDVDFLKLDGSFVRDLATDPSDLALVGAMASVGRALNIPTIAEWVENDAICAECKRLGVGYAQGWGIEKPRPV